jgi:adhesin/invasin
MKRFGLLLLGVLATTMCGGGDGGTGPTPNTIAVNGGNNQVGAAGTALPESLAVIVKDQSGAVLSGVTVTFAIAAGGGAVSPASRVTDAAGIAKTRRTLGPNAGTQTVNASAGTLTPVQFSAVSQINGAVNIANSTTGAVTDTVGSVKAESLVVLVTDQNATPVPGIAVAWTSAGGSVSSASVPTSAAGLSKVRFTYGNAAGIQTATATVTGLVGSPLTVTLTGTAGTAVSIAKTAGDNGSAAPSTAVNYTVQSRDSHGNPKGGVTIDWAVGTGGGSITPPQNVTAANGNATAQRTLGSGLGAQTAVATAAALPGAPADTFTTTAAIVTTVQVADFSFTPSVLTNIPSGTTITWDWGTGPTAQHTVTFEVAGAPTDIPARTSGSVGRQFTNTGTFTYHCAIHPSMMGSVTVVP